uniref:EF-hand domain-containing protein n=1 Tax=Coturnix japonica TaxID=93934 RepID=A0A8C2SVG9_COTJA
IKPGLTTAQRKKSGLKPELTEEQKQEIREAFDLFDTDGSGSRMHFNQTAKVVQNLFFSSLAVTEADLGSPIGNLKAFRLFDDDGTGKISFKNLKRLQVNSDLPELSQNHRTEMIDEADRDGDGEVSEQEFLRIMKKTSLY